MADQYLPYPLPPCPEEPAEPAPQPCPGWDICLPWGGRIYSHNGCVYGERGNPPPDGVYGKIVVANGCIIDALPEDVPLYTGNPCAPLPGDCASSGTPGVSGSGGTTSGGTTGGGSGNTGSSGNTGTSSGGGTSTVACCPPSSASGNLYELDAAGRPLVRCHIEAGTAISVTGDGSDINPYVISASGGSSGSGGISTQAVYIRSGNSAISVTGSGTRTDPFTITHKTGASGSADGMTFDQFGHCTSISTGSSDGAISKYITGIVGKDNVDVVVDPKSKIATIGLRKPTNSVTGTYQFGDYEVSVDSYGIISNVVKKEQEGGDGDDKEDVGFMLAQFVNVATWSDERLHNGGGKITFMIRTPPLGRPCSYFFRIDGSFPKALTEVFEIRIGSFLMGRIFTGWTNYDLETGMATGCCGITPSLDPSAAYGVTLDTKGKSFSAEGGSFVIYPAFWNQPDPQIS